MKKLVSLPSVMLIILFSTVFLQAQKSTELFIPIGKSPGVSGKYTVTGTIDSVNTDKQLIYMQDTNNNKYLVRVTDATNIYLDKSTLNEKNQTGVIKDLQPDLFCEVLFQDYKQKKRR